MQHLYAQSNHSAAGRLDVDARAAFITRTYLHLFGAIALFTVLEIVLFMSPVADAITGRMMNNWMLVLGGFILVSWLATRAAHRTKSLPLQYLALVGFVLAEAVIFVPLLAIAQEVAPGVINSAAIVTMGGFLGLTMIAFWTRKDFTFLGGMLRWAGFCALLAIVAGAFFGFHLGTWFSVGMIVLAGGSILYDTSNILRHYPEDRYVAASLELFASVAMMFWYVLRLFINRD